MSRNNVVYLLIGQRGSGKTTTAKQIAKIQPEISIVSRDEVLMRHVGSTNVDPYSGDLPWAMQVACRLLRRKLSTKTNQKIILDFWTGHSGERRKLISFLRSSGATLVVGLYFVTSLEDVSIWFWQKPGIAKMNEYREKQGTGVSFFSEDAPRRDYEVFHELAADIDSDGFDEVIRVNPLEKLIVLK